MLKTMRGGDLFLFLCRLHPALFLSLSLMCVFHGLSSDCNTTANFNGLMAFYTATKGPTLWVQRTGWGDRNVDINQWFGVTCTGADVTGVILVSNQVSTPQLDGSEVSGLPKLATLRVTGFNAGWVLAGSLPPSWGTLLPLLEDLDLQSNAFVGKLPSEWSSWTRMRSLVLYANNQLHSPSLPMEWGAGMARMELLNLGSIPLSGGIPDTWSSMTSMATFYAFGTGLSGTLPAALAAWSQMKQFVMSNNQLSGALPDAWKNMTLIEVLQLSGNQLSGSLPNSWGDAMTKLQTLDISTNSLTGTLPCSSWVVRWMSLFTLELSNNFITGTLPECWTSRSYPPPQIYVNNNRLRGSLPPRPIASMFEADNKSLSGDLPDSWMNFVSVLKLSKNRLDGTLPNNWTVAVSFQILDVSNNNFYGTLPSVWGRVAPPSTSTATPPYRGDSLLHSPQPQRG